MLELYLFLTLCWTTATHANGESTNHKPGATSKKYIAAAVTLTVTAVLLCFVIGLSFFNWHRSITKLDPAEVTANVGLPEFESKDEAMSNLSLWTSLTLNISILQDSLPPGEHHTFFHKFKPTIAEELWKRAVEHSEKYPDKNIASPGFSFIMMLSDFSQPLKSAETMEIVKKQSQSLYESAIAKYDSILKERKEFYDTTNMDDKELFSALLGAGCKFQDLSPDTLNKLSTNITVEERLLLAKNPLIVALNVFAYESQTPVGAQRQEILNEI